MSDIDERLDLLDAIVSLLDERNHSWAVKDAVTRSNVLAQLNFILQKVDMEHRLLVDTSNIVELQRTLIKELESENAFMSAMLDKEIDS